MAFYNYLFFLIINFEYNKNAFTVTKQIDFKCFYIYDCCMINNN